ncbi:unnamed protein product [Agarophyton chilense]
MGCITAALGADGAPLSKRRRVPNDARAERHAVPAAVSPVLAVASHGGLVRACAACLPDRLLRPRKRMPCRLRLRRRRAALQPRRLDFSHCADYDADQRASTDADADADAEARAVTAAVVADANANANANGDAIAKHDVAADGDRTHAEQAAVCVDDDIEALRRAVMRDTRQRFLERWNFDIVSGPKPGNFQWTLL